MSYSEEPKYDDGSKFKKYFGIALVVIVILGGAYLYHESGLNLFSSHQPEQSAD